jgi:hypothetical protein
MLRLGIDAPARTGFFSTSAINLLSCWTRSAFILALSAVVISFRASVFTVICACRPFSAARLTSHPCPSAAFRRPAVARSPPQRLFLASRRPLADAIRSRSALSFKLQAITSGPAISSRYSSICLLLRPPLCPHARSRQGPHPCRSHFIRAHCTLVHWSIAEMV